MSQLFEDGVMMAGCQSFRALFLNGQFASQGRNSLLLLRVILSKLHQTTYQRQPLIHAEQGLIILLLLQ
ncbi:MULTISPECIES: hypothetical protein [Aeromonas]|uniref:hypothetical protein n=1 Tax=Aeromonas TaxID=642 RepID=UPI001CCC8B5B|nr:MULTISPECIES: hypothetical protein [Aeromonas]UBO72690.1 hypothetical protein KYK33_12530 [Aeromonas rivuli]WEE23422.1 hypothetical protein PY772_08215 [Aeromonas caviae]